MSSLPLVAIERVLLARESSSSVVSATVVLVAFCTETTHAPPLSLRGVSHRVHAPAPMQRAQPAPHDTHLPCAVEAYSPTGHAAVHAPAPELGTFRYGAAQRVHAAASAGASHAAHAGSHAAHAPAAASYA